MKRLPHVLGILLALFLCLGAPALCYVDFAALFSGDPDAVAQATMELPEQPSGRFIVLVNNAAHPKDLDQWIDFFSEKEVEVIMTDISCRVVDVDAAGVQLARRYQARLAENQMTLKREQGVLLASKAEEGLFDTLILSQEVADAYDLERVLQRPGYTLISVKGA